MSADPWRYVTPCCESTGWTRRSEGGYYCRRCRSTTTKLIDKKTDTRVQGVGKR